MEFEGDRLTAANWTEALVEIEHVFAEVIYKGRGYVALNVDRSDDPFVQMLVADGLVTAEASVTVQIEGEGCGRKLIDPPIQSALRSLGWRQPEANPMELADPSGALPNFYLRWPADCGWPPALFADLAVRTLHSVWHVEPDLVRVRSAILAPHEVASRC